MYVCVCITAETGLLTLSSYSTAKSLSTPADGLSISLYPNCFGCIEILSLSTCDDKDFAVLDGVSIYPYFKPVFAVYLTLTVATV